MRGSARFSKTAFRYSGSRSFAVLPGIGFIGPASERLGEELLDAGVGVQPILGTYEAVSLVQIRFGSAIP